MDMGLSKEATAELLQRRSAVHAAEQSPGFAEGYYLMKQAMPAGSEIRVRSGYLEKQAFGRAIGSIFSGLGRTVGGVGGLFGAAGKGLINAAVKNPRTAKALGGGIAAGGLGWGASRYFDDSRGSPGVPYLPGGGYNPETEKKQYDDLLDSYSSGIAEANKAISDSADRRKVLQQAVDSNSPNSAQALAELSKYNAQVSAAEETKARHLKALNERGSVVSSRLESVQNRQKQLRERQKSPFWRGLHRLTFRDPDKSYQDALNELQPYAAELSRDNQLISDQRKRMPYYKGFRYNQPSAVQMQREFFPND
jgi:hypothetical protein